MPQPAPALRIEVGPEAFQLADGAAEGPTAAHGGMRQDAAHDPLIAFHPAGPGPSCGHYGPLRTADRDRLRRESPGDRHHEGRPLRRGGVAADLPRDGQAAVPVSTDGTLWVAYPDCGGRLLEGVLPDGSTGPTTRPECRPDEEIGAFVLLDDGFAISWVRASRLVRGERSRPTSVPEPRVARYTREGEARLPPHPGPGQRDATGGPALLPAWL